MAFSSIEAVASESTPALDAMLRSLRCEVGAVHDGMAYRLGAMLEAAHLLANHQRVHAAFSAAARAAPEFGKQLSGACPTWMDPVADGNCDGAVLDLLDRKSVV